MTPVYSIYSLPQPVKNPFIPPVLKVYRALRASLANAWISVDIVRPALALFSAHYLILFLLFISLSVFFFFCLQTTRNKAECTLKFKSTHDMIWIAMGDPGPLTSKILVNPHGLMKPKLKAIFFIYQIQILGKSSSFYSSYISKYMQKIQLSLWVLSICISTTNYAKSLQIRSYEKLTHNLVP